MNRHRLIPQGGRYACVIRSWPATRPAAPNRLRGDPERPMRLPRFRLRTLMILVGLSALWMAGVADLLSYLRMRDHVEVVSQREESGTLVLELQTESVSYYLGPIPLGPCPIAVVSGVVFAV